MPRHSVRSAFARNLGIVGSLIASISAVSLVSSGFHIGWAEPFHKILDQYFVITSNIRYLVEPYVVPILRWISNTLGIHLSLGQNWVDILLLMMVYLGSRVKAYFSDEQYIRAAFMSAVSIAISLSCSSFGSLEKIEGWAEAFQAAFVPLLGFFVYDILYACVGATLDRRARQPWFEEFFRHLWYSEPLLVICVSINLVLAIAFTEHLYFTGYTSFTLVFIVDYFIIAVYWALRAYGYARARENRNIGENVSSRFWRSSATVVSLNVAVVIVSATLFMLGNAGVKAAGAEYSHFEK